MTTANPIQERAKRVKFYHNGERSVAKNVCINKKVIRTWDALLEELTGKLHLSLPARRIHTPVGGTTIRDIGTLEDNSEYVVVTNGRFRKMGYTEPLPPTKKQFLSPRMLVEIRPVHHSNIRASARIHKVPNKVITVYAFANGNDLQSARRMAFDEKALRSWRAIMDTMTEKLQMDKACVKLYTVEDFKLVTSPDQLESGGKYIAVGAGTVLKKVNYGNASVPKFNNSKLIRYDDAFDVYEYIYGKEFPDEGQRKRTLEPIKKTRSRRPRPDGGDSQITTTESSPTSTGTAKTPKSTSTTRSRPPKHSKPKKEEDGVFHAKPVKHTPSGQKLVRDEDEDGVFKAKDGSRETEGAVEVEDTRDTQVELPIDQVEAEEVVKKQEKSSRSSIGTTSQVNSQDKTGRKLKLKTQANKQSKGGANTIGKLTKLSKGKKQTSKQSSKTVSQTGGLCKTRGMPLKNTGPSKAGKDGGIKSGTDAKRTSPRSGAAAKGTCVRSKRVLGNVRQVRVKKSVPTMSIATDTKEDGINTYTKKPKKPRVKDTKENTEQAVLLKTDQAVSLDGLGVREDTRQPECQLGVEPDGDRVSPDGALNEVSEVQDVSHSSASTVIASKHSASQGDSQQMQNSACKCWPEGTPGADEQEKGMEAQKKGDLETNIVDKKTDYSIHQMKETEQDGDLSGEKAGGLEKESGGEGGVQGDATGSGMEVNPEAPNLGSEYVIESQTVIESELASDSMRAIYNSSSASFNIEDTIMEDDDMMDNSDDSECEVSDLPDDDESADGMALNACCTNVEKEPRDISEVTADEKTLEMPDPNNLTSSLSNSEPCNGSDRGASSAILEHTRKPSDDSGDSITEAPVTVGKGCRKYGDSGEAASIDGRRSEVAVGADQVSDKGEMGDDQVKVPTESQEESLSSGAGEAMGDDQTGAPADDQKDNHSVHSGVEMGDDPVGVSAHSQENGPSAQAGDPAPSQEGSLDGGAGRDMGDVQANVPVGSQEECRSVGAGRGSGSSSILKEDEKENDVTMEITEGATVPSLGLEDDVTLEKDTENLEGMNSNIAMNKQGKGDDIIKEINLEAENGNNKTLEDKVQLEEDTENLGTEDQIRDEKLNSTQEQTCKECGDGGQNNHHQAVQTEDLIDGREEILSAQGIKGSGEEIDGSGGEIQGSGENIRDSGAAPGEGHGVEIEGSEAEVEGSRGEDEVSEIEVEGSRGEIQGSGLEVEGSRGEVEVREIEVEGSRGEMQGSGSEVEGSRGEIERSGTEVEESRGGVALIGGRIKEDSTLLYGEPAEKKSKIDHDTDLGKPDTNETLSGDVDITEGEEGVSSSVEVVDNMQSPCGSAEEKDECRVERVRSGDHEGSELDVNGSSKCSGEDALINIQNFPIENMNNFSKDYVDTEVLADKSDEEGRSQQDSGLDGLDDDLDVYETKSSTGDNGNNHTSVNDNNVPSLKDAAAVMTNSVVSGEEEINSGDDKGTSSPVQHSLEFGDQAVVNHLVIAKALPEDRLINNAHESVSQERENMPSDRLLEDQSCLNELEEAADELETDVLLPVLDDGAEESPTPSPRMFPTPEIPVDDGGTSLTSASLMEDTDIRSSLGVSLSLDHEVTTERNGGMDRTESEVEHSPLSGEAHLTTPCKGCGVVISSTQSHSPSCPCLCNGNDGNGSQNDGDIAAVNNIGDHNADENSDKTVSELLLAGEYCEEDIGEGKHSSVDCIGNSNRVVDLEGHAVDLVTSAFQGHIPHPPSKPPSGKVRRSPNMLLTSSNNTKPKGTCLSSRVVDLEGHAVDLVTSAFQSPVPHPPYKPPSGKVRRSPDVLLTSSNNTKSKGTCSSGKSAGKIEKAAGETPARDPKGQGVKKQLSKKSSFGPKHEFFGEEKEEDCTKYGEDDTSADDTMKKNDENCCKSDAIPQLAGSPDAASHIGEEEEDIIEDDEVAISSDQNLTKKASDDDTQTEAQEVAMDEDDLESRAKTATPAGDEDEKDRAATKIQATFRGHRAREEVRAKKQDGSKPSEEEAAATVIQAGYRGYKTRQSMNSTATGDEGKAAEEEESAPAESQVGSGEQTEEPVVDDVVEESLDAREDTPVQESPASAETPLPAPEETPVLEDSPVPEETPEDAASPTPEESPEPEVAAASDETPPEGTPAPEESPTSEETAAPEETSEESPVPEDTAAPEETPEESPAPEETPESEETEEQPAEDGGEEAAGEAVEEQTEDAEQPEETAEGGEESAEQPAEETPEETAEGGEAQEEEPAAETPVEGGDEDTPAEEAAADTPVEGGDEDTPAEEAAAEPAAEAES